MAEELIRQNINLLEFPLWFQNERVAGEFKDGMTWEDRDGYRYTAGYKPPTKTDAIFLLFLLLKSQTNDYADTLVMTRRTILRACGVSDSTRWYDRLADSLKRWKMVGIEFSGTFYDHERYSSMHFGIIDSWTLHEETKELKVMLSPSFIQMMRSKCFFKYLNFSEFKRLHSPLATRLYEILSKSFTGRGEWEIDAVKLAEKIPMSERYPAHIIPKIRTAIDRINRNTSTQYHFTCRPSKSEKKRVIFCFSRVIETAITAPTPVERIASPSDETIALLAFVREEHRTSKAVARLIATCLKDHDIGYVERNILYTNAKATTGYSAYLARALNNDYGLDWSEDQKAAREKETSESRRMREALAEQHKKQHERERKTALDKRVRHYIKHLSAEALKELEQQALSDLPDDMRAIVQSGELGSKQILQSRMERVAAAQMSGDQK